jgi:hypothetical protein
MKVTNTRRNENGLDKYPIKDDMSDKPVNSNPSISGPSTFRYEVHLTGGVTVEVMASGYRFTDEPSHITSLLLFMYKGKESQMFKASEVVGVTLALPEDVAIHESPFSSNPFQDYSGTTMPHQSNIPYSIGTSNTTDFIPPTWETSTTGGVSSDVTNITLDELRRRLHNDVRGNAS